MAADPRRRREADVTYVLTWMLTGILVGWIVRVAMKTQHDFGLIGDLTTGSLGAIVGGWLFRHAGVSAPTGIAGTIAVAIVGAMVTLGALRLLRRAMLAAGLQPGAGVAPAVVDLEAQIARLGEIERRVLSGILRRKPTTPDPNRSFDAQMTFGERVADRVAAFGGSWTFIGIFLLAMALWMAANQEGESALDPYPFILLNLMLSCIAALQAPIIMMSQNRQAAKDRSDARLDYEVNVRAELQITALHEKLDLARDREWVHMVRLLEDHQALLARIEQRLDAVDAHRAPHE
jgi:uncharacterized membrane protein/uncharacterized membrane protein YeaQ/YmgE (transglycosylase-associated protein family)